MSATSAAPTFSSRYVTRLVPGIGTTSSPCASTQASASWPGVQPLSSAIVADRVDQREVGVEGLALEAREVRGRREVASPSAPCRLLMAPVSMPAAERGVGHQADAELAHGRQDLVLEVAGEQRVLGLQRGDRVHGVGAADRLRRRLGEPEVADLAGLDQLGHRADGLLDRHGLVDAVLVVEVDVVDAEPLQRGVAGRADVLGAAVDADAGAVGPALVAELGGQLDLVAAAGDGLADELLVGERAVHVGGVEEGDAEVEGAVDGRDRLGLVAAAVELRHPHAAEAEGGDGERGGGPEGALLQGHVLEQSPETVSGQTASHIRRQPPLDPRDDPAQQLAHPRGGGLAGLEDLGVVERLAGRCRRRGW